MTNPAMNLETQNVSANETGGRLVSPDGRTLPLRGAHLEAHATGGVARVVLKQRFVNPFDEPLSVTYLLPLPSDGAVAGFAFQIGERRITGEIDRREAARERFEQALVEGRTASLLEQERSSLFTQEVGNIPPRTEVVVEIEIDQRLRWLAEGAWEWRFPTVVGPRYMGGRVADAERVTVDVSERGLPARVGLALTIADEVRGALESTSHRLVVDRGERTRATLEDGAALDRDVVVRWPVAAMDVGVSLQVARPAAHEGASYGLLTLVPPQIAPRAVRRDLIFLIDTSGSMQGAPLDQVKRIAGAMIDTLGDDDRVELIAFGSEPVRFAKEPLAATRDGKRAAMRWLKSLRASGGTEMAQAVIEALSPLRPHCQRQVVLMTDGYIGFEREIVREVLERLPEGARLHTVGVGSGINRTLTQWAARAGGGVEIIAGLEEDAERVAERLLARTTKPVVTDVTIEGDVVREIAPSRAPDLYAGAPSLISLALAPGSFVVRGVTAEGEFERRVEVPAVALGEGHASIATLFGRERVEDLETEAAARGDGSLDDEIEAIGLKFRISTRKTSWVAISDEVTVDPEAERRVVRQPHELPHGVSIEGLGLRRTARVQTMAGMMSAPLVSLAAPAPPPGAPRMPPRAVSARTEVDGEAIGAASESVAKRSRRQRAAKRSEPDAELRTVEARPTATEGAGSGAEEDAPRVNRRSGPWVIIAIVIALALAIAAWLALSSPSGPERTDDEHTEAVQRE